MEADQRYLIFRCAPLVFTLPRAQGWSVFLPAGTPGSLQYRIVSDFQSSVPLLLGRRALFSQPHCADPVLQPLQVSRDSTSSRSGVAAITPGPLLFDAHRTSGSHHVQTPRFSSAPAWSPALRWGPAHCRSLGPVCASPLGPPCRLCSSGTPANCFLDNVSRFWALSKLNG